MKEQILEDFIKYAKDKFGYDIFIEKAPLPDSFESIFGASFLDQDSNDFFLCDDMSNSMIYTNTEPKIFFDCADTGVEYYPTQENDGLAA